MKDEMKVKIFLLISLGIHLFLFIIACSLFPKFKTNFVNLSYSENIDVLIFPTIEVSSKEKIVLKEVVKRDISKNSLHIENEEIKESKTEDFKKNTYEIENKLEDKNELIRKPTLTMEEKRDYLNEAIKDPDKERIDNKKEMIKENVSASYQTENDKSKLYEIDQKIHDEKPVARESVNLALNVSQAPQKDLEVKKEGLPSSEPPKSEKDSKSSDTLKIIFSKDNELEKKGKGNKNTDQESIKQSIKPLSIANDENGVKKAEKEEAKKSVAKISDTDESNKIVRLDPERNSIFTQPRYINNPKPIYPSMARRRGYEGEVLLRVEVLANGHVGRIELKRSSGHKILDQSAMETVKQWRFIPAIKDGEAIDLWVNIPIKFQLK